jgi:hypothetical protein
MSIIQFQKFTLSIHLTSSGQYEISRQEGGILAKFHAPTKDAACRLLHEVLVDDDHCSRVNVRAIVGGSFLPITFRSDWKTDCYVLFEALLEDAEMWAKDYKRCERRGMLEYRLTVK